jgi:hypothetical protein
MRLTMASNEPPRRYYVSLGDSVSIDAYAGGPGRGAPALLYKNRDADFPDWAGRDLATRLPGARPIPLRVTARPRRPCVTPRCRVCVK